MARCEGVAEGAWSIVCQAWPMAKRRALWVLCAVVAGLSLLAGGIIVGIAALLVKNPPALFLAVGDYIYVKTLTDEERELIIVDRLAAIDTVRTVKILEHDPYWRMELEVRVENPDPKSDEYWAVRDVCNKASSLWNTFLDPMEVDCAVLPLDR